MKIFTTQDAVRESNKIEGINREPTHAECAEFDRCMRVEHIAVADIIQFVSIYQPNARIRDRRGLDVQVGGYFPPCGGPEIFHELARIVHDANCETESAYKVHLRYESLHPFTDGNGRSGRMLWYWMMLYTNRAAMSDLGFLHAFYYQTLRNMHQV